MFSQLAKRSSQNVDSGARQNKPIDDQLIRNSLQNLCVFCRGKVRRFCFRTVLFVAVASGSAASCTAVTFRLFILGDQVCEKRFKVEC